MPKILAFVGEAGSGKDTLMQKVLSANSDLFEIISCTTRPPREGEVEGKNYFFCSNREFLRRVSRGLMLETSNFNGWYYGTCKNDISKTKINIGVFNPEGIRNLIKHKDIDLKVIYVRASDKTRLLRQLNREENPDVNEIIRRFSADKKDFEVLPFEYITLNNETEEDLNLGTAKILKWLELWDNKGKT